jgi:ribosomal protein L40E
MIVLVEFRFETQCMRKIWQRLFLSWKVCTKCGSTIDAAVQHHEAHSESIDANYPICGICSTVSPFTNAKHCWKCGAKHSPDPSGSPVFFFGKPRHEGRFFGRILKQLCVDSSYKNLTDDEVRMSVNC